MAFKIGLSLRPVGCKFILIFLLYFVSVSEVSSGSPHKNNLFATWEKNFGPFLSNYYLKKRDPPKQSRILNVHLPNPPVPTGQRCSRILDNEKFDCNPRGPSSEQSCKAKGCCFAPSSQPHVPHCFYPRDYKSYRNTHIRRTRKGVTARLVQQFRSPYPKDVPRLSLKALYVSDQVLLVTITDENDTRYRLPFPELPSKPLKKIRTPLYDIVLNPGSTGFKVVRRSSKVAIFDAENVGGFTFADQMIQLSAKLPSSNIFGLGETKKSFKVGGEWLNLALLNHDKVPETNVNLYGAHPVYMGLEPNGQAHGVFMFNSHPMDIALQPSAITYRVIGGPLVLGFALGPKPVDVNKQYTNLIGKPFLPPYWAFGFHICRYGYKDTDNMRQIVNRTRAAGIPFDTQWVDIDYLKEGNDFALAESFSDLPQFVDDLHKVGMHFVIIIDPGVSGREPKGTYPPLDMGLEQDLFIKNPVTNGPLLGKVWNSNGITAFPDFTHPKSVEYWAKMFRDFYKIVKYDGAWIDMNEPSNFVDGSLVGCANTTTENPPYVPGVEGGKLNYKTICMSSKHYDLEHYSVHNVMGSLEAVLTNYAVVNARGGKRPLVISRASSPGLGAYSGHWSGDVPATWDDMAHSVPDMFSFTLFGVPLMGADICGFIGNTTVELCTRWSQLGAFYPFSRNHNDNMSFDQDPAALGIAHVAKKALTQRYALLPYLYTLFWEVHTSGSPVVRPTFYNYPQDRNTYGLEDQFFWGDGLMVAAALKQNVTTVSPYLPKGTWYYLGEDFSSSVKVMESRGQRFTLPAPMAGPVPLIARGGRILPCQVPAQTTTQSRNNPYFLIVALDSATNSATGSLFMDDGETFNGGYNLVAFEVRNNTLKSKVVKSTYKKDGILGSLKVLGNFRNIHSVKINGKPAIFTLTSPSVLEVHNMNLKLRKPFTVTWSS